MDECDIREVAFDKLLTGYANQWELMEDLFSLVDFRLYLYYKYHQWLGPGNDMKNMLGLVISREEFEHKLTKSAQLGLIQRVSPDEREQLELSTAAVRERLALTTASINLLKLFSRFELDEFEKNCVILAYASELDSKYERLIAYLQDDVTRKLPTISLAVQLFLPAENNVEEYISFFDRNTKFTSLFDAEERLSGNLRLRPAVTEFLSIGSVVAPKGMSVFDGAFQIPDDPLVIREVIASELDAVMRSKAGTVLLTGPEGSGRRFQIRHLCARSKAKCVFIDMSALDSSEQAVDDAWIMAKMLDACLCFYNMERHNEEGEILSPSASLMDKIARLQIDWLFLISEKPIRCPSDRLTHEMSIEPAALDERLALFEHYLNGIELCDDVSAAELASKFRFEPAQVRHAVRQAQFAMQVAGIEKLDNETVHRCCYRQVVHRLDKLAFRVKPNYTWDDVVLPDTQKSLMRHAAAHIKYQHKVYSQWGFGGKISYGKGLSILFAGAPGTGKTMCAQVLAAELNMEMYKINISQIVSKYIGETEKNLNSVFREARNSNSILFFDECDALFSKRNEVKDAHDRNANVEVAYLLQQIEEHDGVCILASNLIQNIDAAFMRRITYVVHFPFPDSPARKDIYLRTLPKDAPVDDDIDWDFIAEKFYLSGGHIKNIVISAAFMAAADAQPINMRHVLTAAVNELKKNEIVVVREELREYADLIFAGQE